MMVGRSWFAAGDSWSAVWSGREPFCGALSLLPSVPTPIPLGLEGFRDEQEPESGETVEACGSSIVSGWRCGPCVARMGDAEAGET